MYEWLKLIGIEFEGGWEDDPHIYGFGTWDTHEQSVDTSQLADMGANYYGEYVTNPYPYSKIEEVIKSCRPNFVHDPYKDEDGYHHSCGLHFHISLHNYEHYVRLLDANFIELLRHESTLWADKYFNQNDYRYKRLKDGDHFAKLNLQHINELIKDPDDWGVYNNRWSYVNFRSFAKYQTIEFRNHAAYTDPKMIKEALDLTLDCVDAFLCLTPPKYEDLLKKEVSGLECDRICPGDVESFNFERHENVKLPVVKDFDQSYDLDIKGVILI